jgi:hypothetical protein
VSGTCAHGSAINAVRAGGRVTCGPRIMWAVVNSDGSLARSTGGVASSRGANGQYTVTFPVDVHLCAFLPASGLSGNTGAAPAAIGGASSSNSNAKAVLVATYQEANGAFGAADAAFHLLVVC